MHLAKFELFEDFPPTQKAGFLSLLLIPHSERGKTKTTTTTKKKNPPWYTTSQHQPLCK
jgi:hypothetical protein